MQNVESMVEKGEAGLVEGVLYPAPTSPILCDRNPERIKSSPTGKSQRTVAVPRWNWPLWLSSGGRKTRRKNYKTPIITSKFNEYPKGYPNVAAFLDSDEGYTIYRRFGYLQSRILLNKQEGLRRAEKKLKRMESRMTEDNSNLMCFRDIRAPDAEKHRQLLEDIEKKFNSYTSVLATAQRMMEFSKPGKADCESVGRYLYNRKALDKEEASWVHHRDDLITLKPGREHAWLDGIVEGLLKLCHCKMIEFIFCSQETREKTEISDKSMAASLPADENECEIYYTPSRIAKLTNGILTMIILILLVLPVYILYHMVHDVGSQQAYMICIGILLIFTLGFSSVLSLFTKARRHEILAATAAYCAVLVVFLGNVRPEGGLGP